MLLVLVSTFFSALLLLSPSVTYLNSSILFGLYLFIMVNLKVSKASSLAQVYNLDVQKQFSKNNAYELISMIMMAVTYSFVSYGSSWYTLIMYALLGLLIYRFCTKNILIVLNSK